MSREQSAGFRLAVMATIAGFWAGVGYQLAEHLAYWVNGLVDLCYG